MTSAGQAEPSFANGRERSKLWYQKNREKKKAYAREYRKHHKERKTLTDTQYRARLKHEVFSHYSKGQPSCAFCGEINLALLELDHKNGDSAKHRRENHYTQGTGAWLWAKRNKYPPIFQVLCQSCNSAKGSFQVLKQKALTVEEWIHRDFDKSWEACNSCGLMTCQHKEIVCPFRDFKIIILKRS